MHFQEGSLLLTQSFLGLFQPSVIAPKIGTIKGQSLFGKQGRAPGLKGLERPVLQWTHCAHHVMQAFIWDIQDSMYSDDTGDADNLGPAPKAVMRSSSEMSEQMTRLSGNAERRASIASAQVSLPDDAGSGSVRGCLMGGSMGSASGYVCAQWSACQYAF